MEFGAIMSFILACSAGEDSLFASAGLLLMSWILIAIAAGLERREEKNGKNK